jgi:hypothetical protein
VTNYSDLWYRALTHPLGISVVTDDRIALQQRLYVARAKLGDPDLDQLSVVLPPNDETRLWIVRRSKET